MGLKAEAHRLKNAYTDAPELHLNMVLGSLQLLFWLLGHPSAWHNYITSIDPALPPNFCLAELSRAQWRNPALRQLLLRVYLVWPLLIGLILGGWSLTTGSTVFWVTLGVAGSVAFGVACTIVLGLTGGLAVGVAFGLVTSVLVSLAFGLVSLALNDGARIIALLVVLSLADGIAASVIFGVAQTAPSNKVGHSPAFSSTRQLGGIIVGILIAFGLVVSIVAGREGLNMASPVIFGVIGGIAVGVALGWRTHPLCGLVIGLGFSLIVTLLRLLGVTAASPDLNNLANAALLVALFALSYTLASRIAGPWAGAVAGAFSSNSILLSGFFGVNFDVLYVGVTCVLLGLTVAWWRPVLLYPLLVAWNFLLFRADGRRTGLPTRLLRRNSAFWDEYQLLPLPGLVEHLVWVAERHPPEGQAALTYLTTSRQRWAAQTAQIELEARRLEGYADVEVIGQAHRHLAAGELSGPASALLRSFSRISQDVAAALNQASGYNRRLALSAIEERLDGLLRELTRSSERYAIRFQPIATRWRQLVADYLHELTEAVELRQDIDSPYIIGLPLTDQQEIFVGRTNISARIEQLLLDRRRPPLLLYGQRRMGKTSLLNNLGRLLPSTIIPLFVDLQGPVSQASDHAGFFYSLARSMMHSARQQRNLALPPLNRETLTLDPVNRFDEWLDEMEAGLGSNTLLLSLDEFEALDGPLAEGRLNEAAVLGMFRHMIQHRPRFKLLLSGSHSPDELQRWAGYLINVQVVQISYLNETEARQLVEQPVKNFALRYEPEASQRVLTLTRGHPFLVQLLCAEIVSLKNDQPPTSRRLVRLAEVDAAVPEAFSHGKFFFLDIQHNQVDAAGLAALCFLARQGEGAVVSRASLAQHVRPPADPAQTLVRLIRRELIEEVDGGYRFQVELIRRWFEWNAYRN